MVTTVHKKQNNAIDDFLKALVIKLRLVQEDQLAYYILSIKKHLWFYKSCYKYNFPFCYPPWSVAA